MTKDRHQRTSICSLWNAYSSCLSHSSCRATAHLTRTQPDARSSCVSLSSLGEVASRGLDRVDRSTLYSEAPTGVGHASPECSAGTSTNEIRALFLLLVTSACIVLLSCTCSSVVIPVVPPAPMTLRSSVNDGLEDMRALVCWVESTCAPSSFL